MREGGTSINPGERDKRLEVELPVIIKTLEQYQSGQAIHWQAEDEARLEAMAATASSYLELVSPEERDEKLEQKALEIIEVAS